MARTVLLVVIFVALGAVGRPAAADPPPDLAGLYTCTGVNPNGTAYRSVVEIAKVDKTYRVLWTIDQNLSVLGVGIFSNGVFAVSYFAGAPAVVVYRIDGEKLVGEWVMGGQEGAMSPETLTRMPEQPSGGDAPEKPRTTQPASSIRVSN